MSLLPTMPAAVCDNSQPGPGWYNPLYSEVCSRKIGILRQAFGNLMSPHLKCTYFGDWFSPPHQFWVWSSDPQVL